MLRRAAMDRALKANPFTKDIPVIVVTAKAQSIDGRLRTAYKR